MRKLTLAVGILIATTLFASGQSRTASAATASTPRIGPKALYPDPSLTRGRAETLNGSDVRRAWPCPANVHKPRCTYSQSHRSVPATVKRRVYLEYGFDPRRHEPGEVDHFVPLCAGGSNDLTNLWFQPEINKWDGKNFGFHEKDDLEAWVCQRIKAGLLTPQEAFDRITRDWVEFYLDVKLDRQRQQIE